MRACWVLLVGLVASDVRAESVVIPAAKDNSIYADLVTNSNGAGDNIFTGKTAIGFARRAFIAFDIAAVVPATAIVDSVVLQLSMSRTPFFGGPQPVSLHRVLADWGEADSDALENEGQGAPADTLDVTWTYRLFDTSTWATPGGEFVPAASATQIVNGIGLYTWQSTAMRNDVQGWLDSPATNFGWVLIGNESASSTTKRFDSKEDLASPAHPILTVYFSVSTGIDDRTPALGAHFVGAGPNPFDEATTLRFELPSSQRISLSVFDATGRRVRSVAEGEFAAGIHDVAWDGRDDAGARVGSGVYFVRLEGRGHVVDARRVVLIR
jgi:hypothetical protein